MSNLNWMRVEVTKVDGTEECVAVELNTQEWDAWHPTQRHTELVKSVLAACVSDTPVAVMTILALQLQDPSWLDSFAPGCQLPFHSFDLTVSQLRQGAMLIEEWQAKCYAQEYFPVKLQFSNADDNDIAYVAWPGSAEWDAMNPQERADYTKAEVCRWLSLDNCAAQLVLLGASWNYEYTDSIPLESQVLNAEFVDTMEGLGYDGVVYDYVYSEPETSLEAVTAQ